MRGLTLLALAAGSGLFGVLFVSTVLGAVRVPRTSLGGPAPVATALAVQSATPTVPATGTVGPTETPTAGPGRVWATVLRVWDGNTVLIEGGLSVRYIGADTPGAGMFGRPLEVFGRQAAERNVAFVEGKQVELEVDSTDSDESGMLLRYVYVNGEMVNVVLLREGLAHLAPLGDNTRYGAVFRLAEADARRVPLNLWTLPTLTPTPTPPPTATQTPPVTPTVTPLVPPRVPPPTPSRTPTPQPPPVRR